MPEVAEAALEAAEEPEVAPDMVVVGAAEEAFDMAEVIETMEVTEPTDVPEAEAGGAVEAAEGL